MRPSAEMTPAVQSAIRQLLGELDELRGEVGRLKARLGQAEELADRDTLTPLLNRRAFVRELARARTFAQRYGAAASLVYFDLDGFKAINDRRGHQHGDAVLRNVGERLRLGLRAGDVAARFGGDEFALLLHIGGSTDVRPVLERLGTTTVLQGDEAEDVSWTVGVALCPDEAATAEDLLALADSRLYEKKALRRSGGDGL